MTRKVVFLWICGVLLALNGQATDRADDLISDGEEPSTSKSIVLHEEGVSGGQAGIEDDETDSTGSWSLCNSKNTTPAGSRSVSRRGSQSEGMAEGESVAEETIKFLKEEGGGGVVVSRANPQAKNGFLILDKFENEEPQAPGLSEEPIEEDGPVEEQPKTAGTAEDDGEETQASPQTPEAPKEPVKEPVREDLGSSKEVVQEEHVDEPIPPQTPEASKKPEPVDQQPGGSESAVQELKAPLEALVPFSQSASQQEVDAGQEGSSNLQAEDPVPEHAGSSQALTPAPTSPEQQAAESQKKKIQRPCKPSREGSAQGRKETASFSEKSHDVALPGDGIDLEMGIPSGGMRMRRSSSGTPERGDEEMNSEEASEETKAQKPRSWFDILGFQRHSRAFFLIGGLSTIGGISYLMS